MGCALTTDEVSTSTNREPRRKEEKTFLDAERLRRVAGAYRDERMAGRGAARFGHACGSRAMFYSSERRSPRLLQTRSGTLTAVEPFDFQRSMDFLEGFSPMSGRAERRGGGHHQGDDGRRQRSSSSG